MPGRGENGKTFHLTVVFHGLRGVLIGHRRLPKGIVGIFLLDCSAPIQHRHHTALLVLLVNPVAARPIVPRQDLIRPGPVDVSGQPIPPPVPLTRSLPLTRPPGLPVYVAASQLAPFTPSEEKFHRRILRCGGIGFLLSTFDFLPSKRPDSFPSFGFSFCLSQIRSLPRLAIPLGKRYSPPFEERSGKT